MLVYESEEEKKRAKEVMRRWVIWLELNPSTGFIQTQDKNKILLQDGSRVINGNNPNL